MAQQAQACGVVDINFQRYCNCLFKVAQQAICRVFLDLYHHHQPDPGVYVGEVLANTPGGFNRMGTLQQKTLAQRESPVNMDITLLYSLLQRTCGLKPDTPRDSVWNSPTTDAARQSLEHRLYLIKELRNELGHEPRKYMNLTKEQLEEKVKRLEELCCDAVKEAATRTGRSADTAQKDAAKIESDLQLVLTSTRSIDLHPQQWATLAREELRSVLGPHKSEFSELLLELPQGKKAVTCQQGTLTEVLSPVENLMPQLILLTGEAGAGKTTLCQHSWMQWVAGGGADSDYDLVVWVQCGQVITRDVARLVKERLLPQTCRQCDHSQLLDLLAKLRVLWLMDGLEDAAPEATHLLREILDNFSDQHVVLVTCQPSYVNHITNMVSNTRICTLRLLGLSGEGFNTLLKHLLKDEEYPRFVRDLVQLEVEVFNELRTPLKIKLTATLWQEGTLDIKTSTSLSHLYTEVEIAFVNKISRTLAEKFSLTINEAEGRVRAWLKELYGVAFDMILENKLTNIDRTWMDRLECKSRQLLPSYTECLSAFLTCVPDASSPAVYYSFIHLTQQRYLAAQHLCHQLLSHHSLPRALYQTLQLDQVDRNKLDRLYEVLLQVLATLVRKKKLEERLEEIVIKVLEKCRKCDWLEVVRCSGHSHSVARRVSQHMPDDWFVSDEYLEAAKLMLTHVTPNKLYIMITKPPSPLHLLMPFLRQVARSSVNIDLKFVYVQCRYEYFDKYLQVLYDEEAACTVTTFFGRLTADAYPLFLTKPGIRVLFVLVSDMKALQALVKITTDVPSIQDVHIILDIADLEISPMPLMRQDVDISLNLGYVPDERILQITELIPRLSLKFSSIIFYKVSAEVVLKFIKKLELYGVQVKRLLRGMTSDVSGLHKRTLIPYGTIPTPLPNSTFLSMWRQPNIMQLLVGKLISHDDLWQTKELKKEKSK